jgi:CO/xanthine dehydrogenase FAD-binding subunit
MKACKRQRCQSHNAYKIQLAKVAVKRAIMKAASEVPFDQAITAP